MRKQDEKLLREKMQPVAVECGRLFIDAMILRVRYHLVTAEEHGAEPEDAPQIIADAVDSGSEALRLALDKISERKNAEAWNEARKRNPKT
jgi:hypothetical protein